MREGRKVLQKEEEKKKKRERQKREKKRKKKTLLFDIKGKRKSFDKEIFAQLNSTGGSQ